MEIILKNLGIIGSLIFTSAYIPQVVHLIKVKDSTGISIASWIIWLVGAILLLIYAIHLRDVVFLILTILESIFLSIIIGLAVMYKKK